MPKFHYSNNNEPAPKGVYLAQVVKAEQTHAKSSGNEMLRLTLRTIPDGFLLNYYLVFNGKADGLITQFCRYCEGELVFPEDPSVPFSLTAADVLHRVVFIDVDCDTIYAGKPQAKIKLGGVLSRASALARNPGITNIKLPANVAAPQFLAVMPEEKAKPVRPSEVAKPATPSTGALPGFDDDIPFAANDV